MKILITSDWSIDSVNGVAISIKNLYKELKKDGHDVRILTLSKRDESYVEGDIYYVRSFGIKFYPDLRATFAFNSKILKELIDWHPDIVHSQCEFFSYYFALKISVVCRCPLIHTYHTLYEYYTKYVFSSQMFARPMLFNYIRARLKTCNAIIAPTEKVKSSLNKIDVYGNIKVIPTGIDLDKYNEEFSDEELDSLREKLKIDKDKKIILYLGRIAREKNIDKLLIYVSYALADRDDFVFLIVGGGPYLKYLEQLVYDLGMEEKVVLTGLVKPEEVTKYYKLADIFTCASQSETQGLTYIEALANGLPELVLRDDAIEGVIEDGYNGFIFDDRDSFEEKCKLILDDEDLRKKMSINSKESSLAYSTEAFKDKVFALYEDTLRKFNPDDRAGATYMTNKLKVTGAEFVKKIIY